jgi:hypothetical protein
LPYRICKGSTRRLAGLSNQSMIKDKEEFPVSTFYKNALDAVIMVLPILGILIPLIAILVVPNESNSSYYLQDIYYQYFYNVWVFSLHSYIAIY